MVEFLGSLEDKNFAAKIWPIIAENGEFGDFSISLVVSVNNF